MTLTPMQKKTPKTVGRLPVSFFMVRQVVEQGQWKRQKISMHRAVFQVHPLAVSRVRRAAESVISTSMPL